MITDIFLQITNPPYPKADGYIESSYVLFKAALIFFLCNIIFFFIFLLLILFYIRKKNNYHKVLNNKITNIEQLKTDFLRNISNELKTPLQTINNITDSMLCGSTGVLTKYQKYNLSIIERNGRNLFNQIDNILDFTKLKNGELSLDLKHIDMKSLTNTAITITKSFIGDKNIKVKNNISQDIPYISGDEYRLKKVMFQLISNAVKFTSSGEVIISSVKKDNHVKFIVKDTGMGIPENKIRNVFKTFQQIHKDISAGYGETGIELNIAREIIKLHKGSMKIETERGKGTKFIFTLPLVSKNKHKKRYGLLKNENKYNHASNKNYKKEIEFVEEQKSEIINNKSGLKYKTKILIVDDNYSNRLMIKNYLNIKEDYYIIEAENGEEALKIIPDKILKPDLLIINAIMPQMSGYELCYKIREQYDLFEMPIILLINKFYLPDIVAGLKAGANDYLPVSFDKNELYARVTTLLKVQTLLKELKELNETLEQKVEERTNELNKLNRKLQTEIYKRKKKEELLEIEINRKKLLNRIISKGNRLSDLKTTVDKVLNIIKINTHFDIFAVYLCKDDYNISELFTVKGIDVELFKDIKKIKIRSYKTHSINLQEGEIKKNKDYDFTLPEFKNKDFFKSYLSIPIHSNLRIIGNLVIFKNIEYIFSNRDIEMFQDISREVGNLISRIVAEKELKQSQEQYKAIVEHQPEYINRFSPDLKLTFVNTSYCSYFQKTNKITVNKSFFYEPILEEDRGSVIENVLTLNSKRQLYITEFRVKINGEIRWHRWYYKAIFDKNKKLIEYQATGTDITKQKKAEQILKERETKYRLLFKQMITGFEYCKIIVDDDNKPVDFIFVEVNQAFANFFGLKVEHFVGKRFMKLASKKELESFDWINTYGDVALNNKEITFDVEYPKGSDNWYSVFAYSTQKGYFAAIIENITNKKRTQQIIKASEELFRTVFEASPTGLIIIDKEKLTIDVNNSALTIFGLEDKKDLIKYSKFFIGKDINLKKEKSKFDDIISYEKYQHSIDIKLIKTWIDSQKQQPKRGIVHIEVSFTPISKKDSKVISYLIQIQDVTKNREIVQDLIEQAQELKKLNDDLKTFSTAVSHDLKSPLIRVDGYIQTIFSEYSDSLSEKVKTKIEEIEDSTKEMFQLITNILNLATIKDKEMDYQKVNLSSMAVEIIQKLKNDESDQNKHHIIINPNLIAYGDEGLLRIMLDNLFRNAWKFTKQKNKPKIKFSVKNRNNKQIFYIRDNGAGFDQEKSNIIFEKFRRLHTPQEYEGKGIGLSIVKKVIDKHKGKIWVKSKKGKGTIFYFTLIE